jgi:uncharacterized protein (TIGR02757 family)
MKRRPPHLGAKLEELASRFDRRYLASDPVQFAHRYRTREDREVAAILAASLAYGSVKQIVGSVARVLDVLAELDPSPARAVDRLDRRECLARLEPFQHRFNSARDVVSLLSVIQRMRARDGSIEGFFAAGARGPLRERLSSFARRARALEPRGDAGDVSFFFPDPNDGSACKRLCMFLRWMARPDDGIDLGLWRAVSPAELVMPLDTHTTRICHWNGLCPSPFATWRNAEHVTAALRRFDPNDPVRFDFAISRLGILRVRGADARVRVPAARGRATAPRVPISR